MLVLVADAEPIYAEIISELLRQASYRVVLAPDESSCRRFLERSEADLIVVSSSIPEGPLPDFIRELRHDEGTPIIAVVGESGPSAVASCLVAGADDCVQKPFHPGEFAARVDAVARRHQRPHQARRAEPSTLPEALGSVAGSGLTFDHSRERVYYDGRDLRCTQLEYKILSAMAAEGGTVLPYSVLNERIWGYSNLSGGTLLKGHVSSIRRKLMREGFDPDLIRTVYGTGYALSA